MKTFEYEITDELGIHARPAGELVKEVKKYESKITITSKEKDKTVGADKLMMVMSLGVKKGTTVVITAEGADEDAAIEGIEQFLKDNL